MVPHHIAVLVGAVGDFIQRQIRNRGQRVLKFFRSALLFAG
jgi:hypothetical protein